MAGTTGKHKTASGAARGRSSAARGTGKSSSRSRTGDRKTGGERSSQTRHSSGSKARSGTAGRRNGSRGHAGQDSLMQRDFTLILLFAAMIFLFLCNFMSLGIVGSFFSGLMFGLFGVTAYVLPVLIAGWYLFYVLTAENDEQSGVKLLALAGLYLIVCILTELIGTDMAAQAGYAPAEIYTRSSENRTGGGLLGGSIAYVMYQLLKTFGSVLVLIVAAIGCIYALVQRSILELARDKAMDARLYRLEKREEEERYQQEHPEEFAQEEKARRSHYEESRRRYLELRHEQELRREQKRTQTDFQEEGSTRVPNMWNTDLSFDEAFAPAFSSPKAPVAGEAEEQPESLPQEKESRRSSRNLHEIYPEDYLDEDMVLSSGKIPPVSAMQGTPLPVSMTAAAVSPEPLTAAASPAAEIEPVQEDLKPAVYEEVPGIRVVQTAAAEEVPDGENPSEDSGETLPEASEELGSDGSRADGSCSGGDRADRIRSAGACFDIPVHTERELEAFTTENLQDSDATEPSASEDSGKDDVPAKTPASSGQREAAECQVRKEYVFPPISLLRKGRGSAADSDAELRSTAQLLQTTLHNFGVNVTITDISQGPSVTRYEMLPEMGVKVSKIVSLSDDIKLALAATDIRIEAPIPGKSAIGIEVPNKEATPVSLRDIVETEEFKRQKSRLAFAVGKDIAGKPVYGDIAKMPHVLIAGATGSGKSVCINTIIMSILYHADPREVKLIMIDPKVVELSVYNGIPHLMIPVVTNPQKAAAALNWGVSEMEARYRAFADAKVRDIKGYNALAEQHRQESGSDGGDTMHFMPQLVIIVDELADLMMVAKNDVETAICRLAQLARAAGIHLIIATQRPSVDVITGLIKANMPSRIAFRVSSGVDSRTILDMNGAEKLLGKGDMLFFPQGLPKPNRVQGCFVSDEEVTDVVSFLISNNQASEEESARHQQEIDAIEADARGAAAASAAGTQAVSESDVDELFGDAGIFIIEKNNASIGLLQRRYRIGFNRAARIMDQLCDKGVVGESAGTKSRAILMTPEQFRTFCGEHGYEISEA